MNRDELEGNWKEVRGKAKERWGKLTDEDLETIDGRRDRLEGAVQTRYGIAKEQAREQVSAFARDCGC